MTSALVVNRVSSSGLISPVRSAVERPAEFLAATESYSSGLSVGAPADDRTPFEREKAAFLATLPELGRYREHFVAMHNGRVVDSDVSRNVLVRRFFREHGEGASLYIGFVGVRPAVRVPTSFVSRPR